MISSKKTIRTTSIPKFRNIHSGFWKLQAQNSKIGLKLTNFYYSMTKNLPYKNFQGIQSMIFSKKTIRTTSKPKIRKIHSSIWKLQVKDSQNCRFWPKMALNGPNFAISEFSQHIEYDFLIEDHKNILHTKNQEYSEWSLEVIGQKL